MTSIPVGTRRRRLQRQLSAPLPSSPELVLIHSLLTDASVFEGIAPVLAATTDAFVPQMLNYESVGGVNFKKGCYPGQEVVARSQYRGTIKRRTHLFAAEQGTERASPLLHSDDPSQPAGEVVACATWQGQTLLLAEVKLAALETGQLHLADANGLPTGGALRQLPLPYAITAPQ